MAKAKLNKKFRAYTGVLPPNDHRLYLTIRFGQEVISHCPEHRDPDSITDAQHRAFQLITQASALADADLQDPVKHDEWLRKWNEHSALCASRSPHRPKKPYKTLRGFVTAAFRQQL